MILRLRFHHYVVLVVALIERGDLALTEGIIQRVIDCSGRDAEPRGGVAVNDDVSLEAAQFAGCCLRPAVVCPGGAG